MFGRYTERARRVIFHARVEASSLGSPSIETEHLLLGLMQENSALVNRFMTVEVSDASIRNQILTFAPIRESIPTSVDIALADESENALACALEEADRLGHQQIDVEHLLLGLLDMQDSFAARMLREHGASIGQIRKELAACPPSDTPESRRRQPVDEHIRKANETVRMILDRAKAEHIRKRSVVDLDQAPPNPEDPSQPSSTDPAS